MKIHAAAEMVAQALTPVTQRVVVAGSIRRGSRIPKDIEIVAEPVMNRDLFGRVGSPVLDELRGVLADLGRTLRGGPRYRQLTLYEGGHTLDLFLVYRPSQWGTQLAIRTGPAGLSHLAVANLRRRGMLCRAGRVLGKQPTPTSRRRTIDTPTEREFFELCGLPAVPPEHRDHLLRQLQGNQYRPARGDDAPAPFQVPA